MTSVSRKKCVLYQNKDRKQASKWKWTETDYHVPKKKDVNHSEGKTSCGTTQFPELLFYGTHAKPHGIWGLSEHYHIIL